MMNLVPLDVVVAGHICVDITPELDSVHSSTENLVIPGRLTHVGPARMSLGGAMANTGMALHRLGAKTLLMGMVGQDWLGESLRATLNDQHPELAASMGSASDAGTSYTIVVSPPNVDRAFLHYPGVNDYFTAEHLELDAIRRARWLHFGYPPLMRGVYQDGGRGLAAVFDRVQQSGVLVSLDMAMPDPRAASRAVAWRDWLAVVLPYVDLFAPSVDEIMLMLAQQPDTPGENTDRRNGFSGVADVSLLAKLADELLGLGVPIVVIKLGDQGLYLRTSDHMSRLSSRAAWRNFDWQAWRNRELLAPCFDVEVVGTTGAGDCTIAGLLMAMLQGQRPEAAIRSAVAVGAYCVQSADATSNIPTWSEVENTLLRPWPQRGPTIRLPSWQFCQEQGIYVGPADATSVARAE